MKKLTLVVSFLAVAALIVLASGCTRSMSTGPIPKPQAAQSVPATPTPGAIPTTVIATTVAGATATKAAGTTVSSTPVPAPIAATATKLPAVTQPTATKAAGTLPTAAPTVLTGAGGASTTYTVQQGEWLFSIARKFGVSPYTLAQVNNITPPYTIYPGRVLTIPGSPMPGPTATPGPAPTTYTVQSGDTIYSIGRKFGRTPAAIINANNLANPNFLFPGQVLRIP